MRHKLHDVIAASEVLGLFARAKAHPGVKDDAARRIHKALVDELNAAMDAALAPEPAPTSAEDGFRERPEAPPADTGDAPPLP